GIPIRAGPTAHRRGAGSSVRAMDWRRSRCTDARIRKPRRIHRSSRHSRSRPCRTRSRPGRRTPPPDPVTGDYYDSTTVDGSAQGDRTVVRGHERYYMIEFNHRQAFVKAADVTIGYA
ncbi:MAG TPA: hypothetical protein VII33_00125, partial [Nakamurella sp.]